MEGVVLGKKEFKFAHFEGLSHVIDFLNKSLNIVPVSVIIDETLSLRYVLVYCEITPAELIPSKLDESNESKEHKP